MFKHLARRTMLVVAAANLLAPVGITFAQSSAAATPPPPPPIITGGDPQPTGSAVPSITDLLLLLL